MKVWCLVCGKQCVVMRLTPDGARAYLSTCKVGALDDMRALGFNHDTALVPFVG